MNEETLYPLRNTHATEQDPQLWNWAHNATLGNRQQLRRPQNEAELQQLVASHHGKIRVIGSRMAPGRMLDIAAGGDLLLDLSALSGLIASTDDTVTFAGATLLSDVYDCLTQMDRMLASSPGVISVQTLAGAMATGTHGQGLQQSSLADEAIMIRLLMADGTLREFTPQDSEFGAVQVSMGALGIVTAVTLRTRPAHIYTCFKTALSADTLEQDLPQWNRDFALSKAWWFVDDNQMHVWNAREATAEETQEYQQNNREVVKLNEGEGNSQLNQTIDQTLEHMHRDTQIRGEGGKQFRTVTRFRDFSDVTGDIYQLFCRGIAVPQINVEIGVPLAKTPQIISKIKRWYAENQPHMHYPIIIRCTGASSGWLNPSAQQETCYFGFVVYYADDGTLSEAGLHFLTEVEKLLAAEGGRPHWGKYYNQSLYNWGAIYPQWDAFRALRSQFDPQQKFSNDYLAKLFD